MLVTSDPGGQLSRGQLSRIAATNPPPPPAPPPDTICIDIYSRMETCWMQQCANASIAGVYRRSQASTGTSFDTHNGLAARPSETTAPHFRLAPTSEHRQAKRIRMCVVRSTLACIHKHRSTDVLPASRRLAALAAHAMAHVERKRERPTCRGHA